jgi:hypothetical protein
MRANKFDIKGLKGEQHNGRLVYFWVPPASLQKRRIFKHKTLGTNLAGCVQRWSHFLRQPAKVGSPIQRTTHHEDAETVFG